MKTFCVFYSYFETNKSKINLEFFVKKGINLNENIFYVFLINNDKISVKIPNQKNIKLIFRDNIGHDFGSWKDGLNSIKKTFDYFIFMNDTVCGPFLPRYIPKNNTWYQMFCNLISEKVKLSGLTINYCANKEKKNFKAYLDLALEKYKLREKKKKGSKHVQSMMFCTDEIGLEILKKNIFHLNSIDYDNIYNKSRNDFIDQFEVGMSQHIIKNGFDIAALYVCDIKKHITNDIWHNKEYFGTNVNPMETMFIKKNRIDSELIDFYINTFI